MDEEALNIFIEESKEHLDGIEGDLLALETEGEKPDQELVNRVFRAMHTIKGGAGFLGFQQIRTLSHSCEDILGRIRDGELLPDSRLISTLLQAADSLSFMLNNILDSDGHDITSLLSMLQDTNNNDQEKDNAAASPAKIPVEKTDSPTGETVKGQGLKSGGENNSDRTQGIASRPEKSSQRPLLQTETNLRVNVKILDSLMNLAGELVLTRNQLVQAVTVGRMEGLKQIITQRLDLVTSELQEAVMSTRMQPIGNVFKKFKRVVRDLSKSLDKQISFVIKGEEVELDKTIVEAIGDPLTHLIRNAVDHGIEKPAVREAAGKNAQGALQLSARHEGGHVVIVIEDDGAGIDAGAIREKALSMGLYEQKRLNELSDREILKLILLPGMSTSEKVSDISGRGVGMDVVHTNISKIGGIIDIDSTPDVGTRITITIPLTLAIIPSLIVQVEEERYAIPQISIIELVRVPPEKVRKKIQKIGSAAVLRLRGELLPLVRLSDALGISQRHYRCPETGKRKLERRTRIEDRRDPESPTTGSEARVVRGDRRIDPMSSYNILVVMAGEFSYGLIVDQLLDSEEIVVKPLGMHLRSYACYAGATIQGDGRVAFILDVMGISHVMKIKNVSNALEAQSRSVAPQEISCDSHRLLVVRNGPNEQMAIPFDLIARVAGIRREDIQTSGGRRSIQFHGTVLPVFSVDEVVDITPFDESKEFVHLVLFSLHGKEIGILVTEIQDILVSDNHIDDLTHQQPGVMGSVIIDGELTLLLDIFQLVTTIMPQWADFDSRGQQGNGEKTVLVVEDSQFFLQQMAGFVRTAGFQVLTAMDGLQALEALEREAVDLILTDIEMPNMDGLELTRTVRRDKRWQAIPIIAVTSLMGEANKQRGLEAGIDTYLVKLNREEIINTLLDYL